MSGARPALAALACVALVGCSSDPLQPATLDTSNENCSHCRMAVSDQRFAAQLVAPGEEPRFFDDIGCLRNFLERHQVPAGSVAYVADHRTRTWVLAASAVYVRATGVETPMGSHLLAFVDRGSRDADVEVRGETLSPTDVFGPGGPPAGRSSK